MPGIHMVSLGCVKNMVDAETMLGETLGDDCHLELEPEKADIIIINTCGFIEEAREEAREIIRQCLTVKAAASHPVKVVAAGCWAERHPEAIMNEFPALDAVWGLSTPSDLTANIAGLYHTQELSATGLGVPEAPRSGNRLVTTMPSFAYLRISDGCDNRCHYCAIPLIRGGLRSREPDAVVEEALALERQGAKELVIISQDTTAYGHDLHQAGATLHGLLERLLTRLRLPRLRLLYAHPAHITDGVIDLLRSEPRLCGYLDLPLQSGSTKTLQAMGRGYSRERIIEVLEKLGPKITKRTTFLTGFPGESEADFLESLDLVRHGWFHHVGAFAYSPEAGTPAANRTDQVAFEEAARRKDMILAEQQRVAFAWLDSRAGTMERILIDSQPQQGWLVGRSKHEAPDADGSVFLQGDTDLVGKMVDACINHRDGYDLFAEIPAAKRAAKRRRKRR